MAMAETMFDAQYRLKPAPKMCISGMDMPIIMGRNSFHGSTGKCLWVKPTYGAPVNDCKQL